MWGKKNKDTDTTTIKRTTKIKETYTVPASNLNPEVVIPTGSKIKEEQIISQNPYQTSTLPVQSGNAQIEKGLGSKKKQKSLSSSSSDKGKHKMESSLGNPYNYGLIRDAPVVQSGVPPALNQTGTYQSTFEGDLSENLHLGKNLYGETGYASPYYIMQQPFPGQTVYVEKWKQIIPQHTKNKFLRSSNPQTYQDKNYNYQRETLQTSVPFVGQNNQTTLRGQNYPLPNSNKSAFNQKLPYSQNQSTTQKPNFQSNIYSPTKQVNAYSPTKQVNANSPTKQVNANSPTKQVNANSPTKDSKFTFHNPFVGFFSRSSNANKDQHDTTIKQKTKIDQNYKIPAQNINQTVNVPTRDSDIQYATKHQNQNANLNYSQKPVENLQRQPVSTSVAFNQPQTRTSNVQDNKNYDVKYQNQSNMANQGNLRENSIDAKGQTVIKQKTKIKQNYTIPSQNVNLKIQPVGITTSNLNEIAINQNNQVLPSQQASKVSVQNQNSKYEQSNAADIKYQSSNVPSYGVNLGGQNFDNGKSGDTKNLQYLQSKYGQTDYEMNRNSQQQSQYQASNQQNYGQNSGNMNMNSDLRQKENAGVYGRSATIQPGYAPTIKMRAGFEQERWVGMNEGVMGRQKEWMVEGGMGLGKNLYGETGYASLQYTIQEPFPGQRVYVPQSPRRISNRTKEKFSHSVVM